MEPDYLTSRSVEIGVDEDLVERNIAYNEYVSLCNLYEQLIKKDPDPNRVLVLKGLLIGLHGDNK